MKYRIIKKELCGKIWFEIQCKILFWWFYVKTSDVDWHGAMTSTYNLPFDTEGEAKKYICLQQNPTKTIIKV